MRSDLQNLYPPIYRGILETDLLTQAGDTQFNQYFSEMDDARKNQFALTADAAGLTALERIYEIRANPATDDVEFRRQRLLNRMRLKVPFTFRFLIQRLDDVIGAGAYKAFLGRGSTDDYLDQAYTLYVSVPVNRVGWYEEIRVFVDKIKPANIVFAMHPLVPSGIAIGEQIAAQSAKYHYLLGTWRLGQNAFYTLDNREVVKVDQIPSITEIALTGHAEFTADQIVSVRINRQILIDSLQKDVASGDTTIRYTVRSDMGIAEITEVELLLENGAAWSASRLAVPVPTNGQIVMEHFISHREVVAI